MAIQQSRRRNAEAVADRAAERLIEAITAKPDLVLGLSTGGTMLGVYQRLVEAFHYNKVSFRRVTSVNVDEYVGLPPDHPQSYATYMQVHLFRHVDIDPRRTHIPDGAASEPEREAKRFEALIEALGGFDLLLLGLGRNGHIAFNEPGTSPRSETRVVRLASATLQANRRFFAPGEPQPGTAITIGLATIVKAREIMVLATGASKAAAVEAMLTGVPVVDCPAAVLADHANVQLLLDEAAWRSMARQAGEEPAHRARNGGP